MTGTAGIEEYEVVIVGAGAAGLAAASALGDHGSRRCWWRRGRSRRRCPGRR